MRFDLPNKRMLCLTALLSLFSTAAFSASPFSNHAGYGSFYRGWDAGGFGRLSTTRFSNYGWPSRGFGSAHPRSLIGRYGGLYGGYGYGVSSTVTRGYGGWGRSYGVTSVSRYGNFATSPFANVGTFGRGFRRGYYPAFGGLPVRYRTTLSRGLLGTFGTSPPLMLDGRYISTGLVVPAVPISGGWSLLAEQDPQSSVIAFQQELRDDPADMDAKVGLSMALATAGDLSMGAWHMRQACGNDTKVLTYVVLDSRLEQVVSDLKETYEKNLSRNSTNRHSMFMLASLHYLQGETEQARLAMSRLIRNGDRTTVARKLRELIEEVPRNQTALAQN